MKRIIYSLLILTPLFFAGCEDIIDIQLPDKNEKMYAVEAKITTKENPRVFLYHSEKVNSSNAYTGISGAIVTIADNSQPPKKIELVESAVKKGLYLPADGTNYFGEIGKEYRLSIKTAGIELTATDILSRVSPIDSLKVKPSQRGEKRFLGIFTYGKETEGLGNYYKWDIYLNHKLLSQAQYLVVTSDEQVDGNYINGFEIFTDFHDLKKPQDRKLRQGDTVMVNQTSISKITFDFYAQMFNQSQTGGLFSVPPANVKGNFNASDGRDVLGLFSAHDISSSNIVVIDESIEILLRK